MGGTRPAAIRITEALFPWGGGPSRSQGPGEGQVRALAWGRARPLSPRTVSSGTGSGQSGAGFVLSQGHAKVRVLRDCTLAGSQGRFVASPPHLRRYFLCPLSALTTAFVLVGTVQSPFLGGFVSPF